MIFVDALRPCGAPWPGGVACHMVSDESVHELKAFAERLGMSPAWVQQPAGRNPHFDLSPRRRARALQLGATACDRRGIVAALERRRARAAGDYQAYLEQRRPAVVAAGAPR